MTIIVRLLPLLLFLVPPGLREYYLSPAVNRGTAEDNGAAQGADEVRHPIVLVPGFSCPELEVRLTAAYRPAVPRCGARKGRGWFGLWANSSDDIPADHYVPCFMEQMSLAYDPAANDYRNLLPGVETRVRSFGSSRGFHRNSEHPEYCLTNLKQELERIGYHDGATLFGAPYDPRHAPPVPGVPSEVFSRYFRQLTRLVEDASGKNQGRKVVLFGHSFGGMVALRFVLSTPMAWRRRYIKHLVLVAPLPAGGFVKEVHQLASGPDLLYIPTVTPLSLRPMWRTFESAISNFPSPAVFGRRPLVVTKARNYSAHDMEDFLAAVGFRDGVEPFRRRAVPRTRYDFEAPMVPTTCINGVGVDTVEQVVYWDGDFDAAPEIVNGDGDGTINLISALAFDEEMQRHPGQNKMFKTIKLHGAKHSDIVTLDWALKRVVQEILEANRI